MNKNSSWMRLSGPIITAVVLLGLEVLARHGIDVPNVGVFLVVVVVYDALVGRLGDTLATAGVALAYHAYYESGGLPLLYQHDELERVVSTTVAAAIAIAIIFYLKARARAAEQRVDIERRRAVTLLESITDPFFAVDSSWRYTYANGRAEAMVGRPRAGLIGKSVWEEFPDLLGTAFDREYHRALADQTSVDFEEYYRPFDTWYEVHAYPSDGGLSMFVRPINDRKRAEAALRTHAHQQAAVAALGMRSLTAERLQAFLDDAARVVADVLEVEYTKVLELEPDGAHLLLRAAVGFEGVGRVRVDANENSQAGYTLEQGEPVIVTDLASETRFRGPDLLVSHGVASGMSVIIGPRERPFGILGAHTRRHRAFTEDDVNFFQAVATVIAHFVERHRYAAVEESERRFRELAENLGEALFLISTDGERVFYANPAYETIWGRSVGSLYERPHSWLDAVHPADQARTTADIKRHLPGQYEQEFRIIRPDGDIRWIKEHLFPVSSTGDAPERLVGIAEDITERRQAEENARRLHLTEAAKLQAEAGIRARDEVLAVVSHDLRSPLSTIALSAQAVERCRREEAARYTARIGSAVQRMERLIADLLDASRLESGRMTMHKDELELATLLPDVCDAFRARALAQGVTLEVALDAPLPPIWADRDRLLQVLSNLLENALRCTQQGAIAVRGAAAGNGEVQLSVSDTGVGIAPEDLPHVFDRFWRSSRERRAGAGLGLSIVKGIVEAHGGRVSVASELDVGTSFHITLPAARPVEDGVRDGV